MAIKQQYTKWVKKEGKRGYVIDTRTGKKVTGKIKLVTDTTRGKAGEKQTYKKGVGQGNKPKPSARGAGVMPGRPSSTKTSGPKATGGKTGGDTGGSKTGGGKTGGGGNGVKPPNVGDLKKGPRGGLNRWNGRRWVRASKGSSYQAGAGQKARKPGPAKPQQMTAAQYAEWEKSRGGVSAPKKPKIGDTRTIYRAGKQVKQTYSARGWIDKGSVKSGGQWGGIGR